jgi:hypothetical protein
VPWPRWASPMSWSPRPPSSTGIPRSS